jgi:hydrogenase assembly chaperone HypC/HupF
VCIGIPKRVVSVEGEFAWCEGTDGVPERINMMLVGPQEKGDWVLTSLGLAREALSEAEAATINDALAALAAALRGDYDPSRHFADLNHP